MARKTNRQLKTMSKKIAEILSMQYKGEISVGLEYMSDDKLVVSYYRPKPYGESGHIRGVMHLPPAYSLSPDPHFIAGFVVHAICVDKIFE
jgi:hypothetical protein